MDTSDRLQPAPENTAFDFALLAAKVATLAFPWAGPGVFLFDVITGPLRAKRLTDWCEPIRIRLNDLSARVNGLTPGALAANEAFLSAFAEATQAALKTHQPEKIEALRNAVLNIALGYEPMADRQAVFLGFVSRFSSLHLSLLRFFQDPGGYCTVRGKKPPSERDSQAVHLLIFDCLDGIREGIASTVEGRDASPAQFLDVLVQDLAAAHLTSLSGAFQKPPPYPKWTTHLGDDFLDFIMQHEQAKIPGLTG